MTETADIEMRLRGGKSATAFRTISEVSADLDVPQHVLRFWESKFSQIKPLKRGGGRRYYRPEDVELLRRIQVLLYKEGYTIKGVQRLLKESRGTAGIAVPANDSGPDEECLPPVAGEAGAEAENDAAPADTPTLSAPYRPSSAMVRPSVTAALPSPSLFDLPPPVPTPVIPPALAPGSVSDDGLPLSKRRELEAILDELQTLSRLLKG